MAALALIGCAEDGGEPSISQANDAAVTTTPDASGVLPAADAAPSASDASTGPTSEPGASDAASSSLDAASAPADAASADAGTREASVPVLDAGAMPPEAGSGLPPLTDPGAKGPFEIQVTETLEGLATHILIAPKELGRDGIKHPILVWINGASAGSSSYRAMLDNVAAHGIFLLDDKQSAFATAPEVEAQRAAIDWAIAQANKQGGPYFGKLDTTRIAIAGHSLGSVASFGNVKDPRISTSIHMAGGVIGNPEGDNDERINDLHAPTAFLCGDRDSNGLPRVQKDFEAAPKTVPLYFGTLAGVSHTDEFSKTNGGRWGRVVMAWLRWRLVGDESFAKFFRGPNCEFCTGDWKAQKRNID